MSGDMWAEQGGLVYDLRRLEKLLRESLDAAREAKKLPPEQTPGKPSVPAPVSRELIAKVRHLQKQIRKTQLDLPGNFA